MPVAIIVDIRAADIDDAATTFFEPIRNGFTSVFNLQSMSLEKEDLMTLVICRSHPDDCERILSPPYMIHTAYEAIQWFNAGLDSDILDSTPIDPQSSIEQSFRCCDYDNLSHIILISHHHDTDTLAAITRSIRQGRALTFFAVCPSLDDIEKLRDFENDLQSKLCSCRAVIVVPGPDVWECVFRDIRGLLIIPRACELDLSGLMKRHSITQTEFHFRNILENLALPKFEKVCLCHGRRPAEIDANASLCRAIQIGCDYFPLSADEPPDLESDVLQLVGKCFVKIDDVCESQLTGSIFVGWQTQTDELFEALRRSMTRRNLALISEGKMRAERSLPFSSRYMMTFTNEGGDRSDSEGYGYLLMRELISTDQILVGWRTKTITDKQIGSQSTDQNMSFGELIDDLSSVLFRSSFHEQMRALVVSSTLFKPSTAQQ